MLAFVAEELGQLFTRPWVSGELKSTQVIVDTITDYFKDEIMNHIMPVHTKKLALETLQRLVSPYIEAMFARKITFDDQVANRIDSDLKLLTGFAEGQKYKDKQIKAVLQVIIDLKELITSEVGEVKNHVEALLKHHSDFQEEMACFMIENRDNMDRADKRAALNEIKLIFQKRNQTNNDENSTEG